jgi:hypothetical protein
MMIMTTTTTTKTMVVVVVVIRIQFSGYKGIEKKKKKKKKPEIMINVMPISSWPHVARPCLHRCWSVAFLPLALALGQL